MANDIDQQDQTPVPGERSDDTDSPEDVVRRLLESEQGNTRPPPPEPRDKVSPRSSNPQPNPGRSIAGRMTGAPRRKLGGVIGQARDGILAYRPTARHMAVALLSAIFVVMPWLIPALALLGLFLLLVSYLAVGRARSGELIANWHGRLARTNPDKAEALRQRAERAAAGLSGLLLYLPERWTAGLYLPDFTRPDEPPETLTGDPFERLSKEST